MIMTNIKNTIEKSISNTCNYKSVQVETSSNEKFGDFSTNIALKDKEINPEEVVNKINFEADLPFTASVVGRFINFKIKDEYLVDNLKNVDENYGKSDLSKGKLAIVEYSSPNIAKPFGVGHLRSTVIGDSVANLLEAVGYKVMRDNHLGDWGTQFGKVICAIKKWGNIKEIENSDSPIDELVRLYVKFHEESEKDEALNDESRLWFKKLEDGDIEARKLWQQCVDWSFIEFEKIYNLLNIKFDKSFNDGRGLGESFFESRMSEVVNELSEKKMLKEGENGAKLVFFENDKYPPLMILKKDGTTLYSTRDLATDKYRKQKYDPDLIVNEVGSEQGLYFKQIIELEKILGWYKDGQRVHVGHGLFLTGGKKMSTRAGKTVKLEDVLNEAVKKAMSLQKGEQNIDGAKMVGIGAIKYFDLLHHPLTNINFDWDKMLSLDGNSGPYLQYTVARINSLLEKSNNKEDKSSNVNLNDEERSVLRTLVNYKNIVESAAISYSPNVLCNYLYELASKFNTFYNKHKIINDENEAFRLKVSKSVGTVLKNGLSLLGIQTPERM